MLICSVDLTNIYCDVCVYIGLGLNISSSFFAGKDCCGNSYFISAAGKRFVVYNKKTNNASTVQPVWHAWLRYVINQIPEQDKINSYCVQNFSGTDKENRPHNHLKSKIHRYANLEYESWSKRL